jgi:hypothetical protein
MATSLASDVASKPQRIKRGYSSTQSRQLAQRTRVVISPLRQARGASVSDEELLLRVYAGEEAVKTMVEASSPREYLNGTQPLVRLIEELSRKKDCRPISIRKTGLSLTFEKISARGLHKQASERRDAALNV